MYHFQIPVGVVRCPCRCHCRPKWSSSLQPRKPSSCLRIGRACSTRTPFGPRCRTCSNCCFTSKPHRLSQQTSCPFNCCSIRARSSSPCCPSPFDCLLISSSRTQCTIGTCLVNYIAIRNKQSLWEKSKKKNNNKHLCIF